MTGVFRAAFGPAGEGRVTHRRDAAAEILGQWAVYCEGHVDSSRGGYWAVGHIHTGRRAAHYWRDKLRALHVMGALQVVPLFHTAAEAMRHKREILRIIADVQ